jgi:energy-coupling factor transport system ATP-binding protein
MLTQRVGMVFQNPGSQLFHLKVEDEIAFGPRNLGLDEIDVEKRTNWALETMGLSGLRHQRPSELSGGQKQCVAIASVLSMRPQVLVLDEPTASLDVPSTWRLMESLAGLNDKQGITIVMIEHRLGAAIQHADRAILMEEGQIIDDGSPELIFVDQERRNSLGLRRPGEQPMTPWETIIQSNGHRSEGELPLLSLERVWAGYDGQDVIQDINISIYPGDFTALVGDNGAGKTTLGLVAAGLLKPMEGRVLFNQDKRPQPGLDVALLFQNPMDQLFTDSVNEEVAFAPENYNRFDRERHLKILQESDLLQLRDRRPNQLSIGQGQRTALAASVAMYPRFVILDEPTLGQDWGHLQRLMDFLRVLNNNGTAVLLISHDYKLVHHYARRIILIENGRIKLKGSLPKSNDKL